VKPGERYGYLAVTELLTGAEAEREPQRGAWARVRCVCGRRQLVRARHLRWRARLSENVSCGCRATCRLRNERRRCA
jgi:hypothetical protein